MGLAANFHHVGYAIALIRDDADKNIDLVHGENYTTLTTGKPRFETAYVTHTQYQAAQILKGIRRGQIDAGQDDKHDVHGMKVYRLIAQVKSYRLALEDVEQVSALMAVEKATIAAHAEGRVSAYEKDLVMKSMGRQVNVVQAFKRANPGYFLFGRVADGEQLFMHRTRDDDVDTFAGGDYFALDDRLKGGVSMKSGLRTATRFSRITDMAPVMEQFKFSDYPSEVCMVRYVLADIPQKQSRQDIIRGALATLPDVARNAYDTLVPPSVM